MNSCFFAIGKNPPTRSACGVTSSKRSEFIEAKRFESEAIRKRSDSQRSDSKRSDSKAKRFAAKRRERNGDLNFRNGAPVCSETLISARVPASREPGIVFAADRCSVAKFRSPFRSGKASFSLQTGAPSRNSEANGCRRRAKVAKRCGGVNWGPRDLAPLGTPPGTSNSPPDIVFNFCSTSGPVCSGILQTSTGLQRKRCFSGAKQGPEFGR